MMAAERKRNSEAKTSDIMAEIKILEQTPERARVQIKGTTFTSINALRRAILNSVPTLAIENVTIYKNDSIIFDEFLAHRLGLLPVRTDLKTYHLGDKVKMVLEKEGPCTVYAKDIKISDPKIEIVGDHIPITEIRKGGTIQIEMEAVLATGREHVKWQPATVGYEQKSGDTFILNIESTGALDVDEILDAAFKSLLEKNSELEKEIKK